MKEWEVGVIDIPKMYCTDPTINDHCIYFKGIDMGIPLQSNRIFSYFNTRKSFIKLTSSELHKDSEKDTRAKIDE